MCIRLKQLTQTMLALVVAPSVLAAPGTLSDIPLPFVVSPQPNILLMLDDSGSMENQQVITSQAQEIYGVSDSGSTSSLVAGELTPFLDGAEGDINLFEYCSGVNGLAYDPTVNYKPWAGVNRNGDPYPNGIVRRYNDGSLRDVLAFSADPYVVSSQNRNITNFMYIRWDDADGDGEYDAGECGSGVADYETSKTDTTFNMVSGSVDTIVDSTSPYGVLYDPGGPGFDYANNESATFTIEVAGVVGATTNDIVFELPFLNLDNSTRTSANPNDVINIYKINLDDSTTLVHTITSSLNSRSYNFSRTYTVEDTSRVYVEFLSNSEFTREGFKFTWRYTGTALPDSATDVEEISKDGMFTIHECRESSYCTVVADLPDDALDDSLDTTLPYNTKVNYANWYSYYRDRRHTAAQAMSQVIKDSEVRMGFATLNEQNGAPISNMLDDNNKLNMYHRLFERSSKARSNDTPLKRALLNAGKYFDAHDNPSETFFGRDYSAVHTPEELTVSNTPASVTEGVLKPGNSGFYSPILNQGAGGQCQQNFTVLFSDGVYNDIVDGDVGNQDAAEPNWNNKVYSDGHSNTLADIALKYFKQDLVNDDLAPDELNVTLHDQSIPYQHMSTYTVGFGVEGTLTGIVPALDRDGNNVDAWPDPALSGAAKIDDMRHAAFNGRGEFLSAFQADALIDNLDEVISEISTRDSSIGTGSSFSSYQLFDGSLGFQSFYNTESWWGDLIGYEFDGNTSVFQSVWSVDERMASPAARAARQIITSNGSTAIPFEFPDDYESLRDAASGDDSATLNQHQINDLLSDGLYNLEDIANNTDTESANLQRLRNQIYGRELVAFLRGDSTYEGRTLAGVSGFGTTVPTAEEDPSINLTQFRNRLNHYFGTFIHSQAEYVGAPSESYNSQSFDGASTYLNGYVTPNANRRQMVFVGSNAGMLHGFYVTDATGNVAQGGQEIFAYIPSMVSNPELGGRGLHNLAQAAYRNLPMVDGGIASKDVFVDKNGNGNKEWRTYLVGALRGGGKGVYVLDITDPAALAIAETNPEDVVVKEFTHDELGYVHGEPHITLMKNGRWAAIVPSGYNNFPQGQGTPKLFVIYLDGNNFGNTTGNASGYEGIFNDGDGQGDYSIVSTNTRNWPAGESCVIGNECTINAPVYARGLFTNASDSSTFYRYADVTALSYPGDVTCETSLFGGEIEGATLSECSLSDDDGNGLSAVAIIDLNSDEVVDRAYAGDLHGNLWVFDLDDTSPANWRVDDDTTEGLSGVNEPLFVACSDDLDVLTGKCSLSDRQPIMPAPRLVLDQSISDITDSLDILVSFGTGQYLVAGDKGDTSEQNFYTVLDTTDQQRLLTRSDLAARTFSAIPDSVIPGSVGDQRTVTQVNEPFVYSLDPLNSAAYLGWYMSLPDLGERVALEAEVLPSFDLIFFASIVPEEQICSDSSGFSYLNFANLYTGQSISVSGLGEINGLNVSSRRYSGIIVGINVLRRDGGIEITVDTDKESSLNRSEPEPEPEPESESLKDAAGIKSRSILR